MSDINLESVKEALEQDLSSLSGYILLERGLLNKEKVNVFPALSLFSVDVISEKEDDWTYMHKLRGGITVFVEKTNVNLSIEAQLDIAFQKIIRLDFKNIFNISEGIAILGLSYNENNFGSTKGVGYIPFEIIFHEGVN